MRAVEVNAAAVVRLQVFATAENADVPLLFLYEHDNIFVHEVPADVVIFACRFRVIDRKGDIPAAQGRTRFTQIFFGHVVFA
ncbi:MAG: hypothetical protein QM754_15035 [Tepidisphaeraceae bacterium]